MRHLTISKFDVAQRAFGCVVSLLFFLTAQAHAQNATVHLYDASDAHLRLYTGDLTQVNQSLPAQIDVVTNAGLQLHTKKPIVIKGHFDQASAVTLANNLVVAAFDINNQHVELWKIGQNDATVQPLSPIKTGEIEALCMGTIDELPHTFIVDTYGMLHQYALSQNELVSIREFPIGPGIKSCAVSSDQLLLADEFAGVWVMDASPEAEIARELIFTSNNYPIEGVAAAPDQKNVVAWVSPEFNGVWVSTACDTQRFGFDKPIAPEAVAITSKNQGYVVSVYDDITAQTFQGDISLQCKSNSPAPTKPHTVSPAVETTPVSHAGDAADDPAIWVNKLAPHNSLVLGTDKKGGLASYTLKGELQDWLPVGRVNNVDIRYDISTKNGAIDIAVASNRTNQSLSVFSIEKQSGDLTHLGDIPTGLKDVYGLCLFNNGGALQALINDTSGDYERYTLTFDTNTPSASLIQQFRLPSQPEGCVVDDHRGTAFLGEEATGIWLLDVTTMQSAPIKIIDITAPVEADIEGLALYNVDNVQYLIASSQGNNQYAIYETIPPYHLMGIFNVTPNWQLGIDGVSETDGLAATNASLGTRFPKGLLVVQDGRNVMPTAKQNFKLIDGATLSLAIRNMTQ